MSKKAKSLYYCAHCGHQELKWVGRCPACQEWGSFQEEELPEGMDQLDSLSSFQKPQILNEVKIDASIRIGTNVTELDRLLGGGIMAGSVLLLVGDPGVGKSTLSLLVAGNVATAGKVLYVSGEESTEQTKHRADRLGSFPDSLYVLAENNLELIAQYLLELKPRLVIIDSIQTVFLSKVKATPGSPSQIKEATITLIKLAKQNNIPIILIGQVTKESQLAGPRVLEHLVDTVVYLEGNRNHSLRVARVVKNRFGSTEEVAMFEMTGRGFQEVTNPSAYLLEGRNLMLPGSVIVASARGTRPIFTEIQTLVTEVPEGIPPRQIAIGIDRNRLLLVTAVLQRWVGERLGNKNIFVSTAGGMESDDPAFDLGIAASLLSSMKGLAFQPKVFWLGELTLSGEVRGVPDAERLLAEANRLGFTDCVLGAGAKVNKEESLELNLYKIPHLRSLPKLFPVLAQKE